MRDIYYQKEQAVEEKELASLRKEYLKEREYLKNPAKVSIDWTVFLIMVILLVIMGI